MSLLQQSSMEDGAYLTDTPLVIRTVWCRCSSSGEMVPGCCALPISFVPRGLRIVAVAGIQA